MQDRQIKRILALETPEKNITVNGWVKTRRDSKEFTFLELNDGSCRANIQVIVEAGLPCHETALKLTSGAAVKVAGDLVECPPGKEQKFEVKASGITVYGECDAEAYPIQKKKTSDEFLRTVAHLRPRTNKYAAMLRIRAELSHAIHRYFREEGFFYVHTPLITTSDCEGAGQMFQVTTLDIANTPKTPDGAVDYARDFFGKKTSLTVSGQLEGEALALGLGRIYTFGPAFRAENSNTYRHCSELWMIEPEAAFFTLQDDMELAEGFLKSIITDVLANCPEDIELFARFVDKDLPASLSNITENTFERLAYTDAVGILEKHNGKFENKVSWGVDLNSEHERFLVEQYFKKPVIMHNKPATVGAFYMKLNDDGKTVRGMDVLVPRIGEIIGGSERENRLGVLERKMAGQGLSAEAYSWYADLRRFGSAPHAGFGLGFERALMLITGIANIRDVSAFPRVPGWAEF
ncbi:MAG: asparagine--tRNA ligase [Elusimicrobiaceae bacterium]|nr:asparagine--tRNA ligase [Elusimicrobiaceae bacterium]